jgi:hypothetical protein
VSLLNESEAIECIERWLKIKYPKGQGFKVSCKKTGAGKGPDCKVFKKDKLLMQIEVKGNEKSSDLYDGLGQCMWYLYDERTKTYLAVPYDLSVFNWSVKEIKDLINYNKAWFGLIAIGKDGKPRVVKKARVPSGSQ